MGLPAEQIEEEALGLKREGRARLALKLIESLDRQDQVDEAQIEERWIAEAEERARQIDAGEMELIPAEVVLKKLEAKYK